MKDCLIRYKKWFPKVVKTDIAEQMTDDAEKSALKFEVHCSDYKPG